MADLQALHLSKSNDITGSDVHNVDDEQLGTISNIVLDTANGRIAYAVLSFGGLLGMGDKLFAIPWEALAYDLEQDSFQLNVPKETLEKAEGFDKDNWPDMANSDWNLRTYQYYNYTPYWT